MYHKISNLYINSSDYYTVGLFTTASETSTIKNLIMENVNITNTIENTDGFSAGGIIGYSAGNIINCGIKSGEIKGILLASKVIYGSVDIGGICGDFSGGEIRGCYNKAKIYSESNKSTINTNAGGICGLIATSKTNITDCYNMGEIVSEAVTTSRRSYGSIISSVYHGTGTINNCYSSYELSICGKMSNQGSVKINNSYFQLEDVNLLKEDCSGLGDAFVEDTKGINNGYPILAWELEITK